MPVLINGTTGITTPGLTNDGSQTISTGTANGVTYLNGSKVLTSGSALVFDGSNLGLGVTPSAWATYKALQVNTTGVFSNVSGTTRVGDNFYYDGSSYRYLTSSYVSMEQYNGGAGGFAWFTAPSGTAGASIIFTQAMTLDALGNLLMGTTTNTYASRFSVKSNLDNVAAQFYRQGTASGSAIVLFSSNAGGTETLKSYIDSAGGTLVTTSDETQKENLIEIENAAAKVSTLRSVIGNYIGDKTKHPFLIAQDVQKVLPEAVSITPSGSLGLAYTDTIPLLVAAIKEQQAIINAQQAALTALTARVTALEGN